MVSFSMQPTRIITARRELVNRLDLKSAAQSVASEPLSELPALISDRSLSSAIDSLADQVAAELMAGFVPLMGFLYMPKKQFGSRPLAVLSPETRVALGALVKSISPEAPWV